MADFYMFDLHHLKWTSVSTAAGSIPSDRYLHGLTASSGKLYLFGGRLFSRGTHSLNCTCCLTRRLLASGRFLSSLLRRILWSILTCLVGFCTLIGVSGSCGSIGSVFFNDLFQYDPSVMTWNEFERQVWYLEPKMYPLSNVVWIRFV